MKQLVLIAALVGLGVAWTLQRLTTTDLRAQIALARQESAERASLQNQRHRLQRLLREAEESARREHAAIELARAQSSLAAREKSVQRPPPSALTIGEWLPVAAWQNRGRATPATTVETALWAAAGGDVPILQGMLLLDEPVRTKTAAILSRLPEGARATYTSPEHLIAAFTTKSIPLGAAQVVWQHEPAPDEAIACVFVKNPDSNHASPSATPIAGDQPGRNPPVAAPNNRAIAAYLSLRRTDDGWRLVVPVSAVEKIAKELGMKNP